MSKQYGLILPNKSQTLKQPTAKKPSIFDENSDSDADEQTNKPTGLTKTIKTRDKLAQNRALAEDPTVFQYDEIYDEMAQRRNESKLARKDLDKKPKYIGRLLKTAERRKRENELRIERQIQKEREIDGDKFSDKETFVTNAYKKKLEELKKLEEEEEREEYLESIGDVKKQGNLDGFYRHLYEQKVNYEEANEKKQQRNLRKRNRSEDSDSAEDDDNNKQSDREKTGEQENDEELPIKKQHLSCNLDADSDFSIDSSSSESDENEENPKTKDEKTQKQSKTNDKTPFRNQNDEEQDGENFKIPEILDKTPKKPEKTTPTQNTNESSSSRDDGTLPPPSPAPTKPKIDIWKKRTIGEVFEAAKQRYFERKSLRDL